MRWKAGDACFFVANGQTVIPATVTKAYGKYCMIDFNVVRGRILPADRLFRTREQAEQSIQQHGE